MRTHSATKRRISYLNILSILWLDALKVLALKEVKIAVIHDFEGGLSPELQAASRIISRYKENASDIIFDYEEHYIDSSGDFAKTGIFRIGRTLRSSMAASAVVGPSNSGDVLMLHPHIVLMDIPHLAPVASDPTFDALDRFPKLIRMQKSYKHQISAILDIITRLKWKTLAIVSSETDYAHHACERLRKAASDIGVKVLLNRRLSDQTEEVLDTEQHLNEIRRLGQRAIILIGDDLLAGTVLREAMDKGMTSAGWAWLLWSDAVDLAVTGGARGYRTRKNIFSQSRTSSNLPDIPGLMTLRTAYAKGNMYEEFLEELSKTISGFDANYLAVKKLKYIDAVLAASYGLAAGEHNGNVMENIMSLNGAAGVTEDLNFDNRTQQAIYSSQYEILNSKTGGRWWVVGKWHEPVDGTSNASLDLDTEKLTFLGGSKEIETYLPQIEYQIFEVVTIHSEPFVNVNYDHDKSQHKQGVVGKSTVQFSGFCIELLQALSSDLGFKYKIRDLGPDGKFGSRNPISGYWNGLIGEVVSGKADLIVAPITITAERMTVVDMTNSYIEAELKFAINRDAVITGDESAVYMRFSFLRPFSPGLWVALLISIIAMSLYLTLVSRLSPYGAHGRYFQSERGSDSCVKTARRRSSAYAFSQEMHRRRNSVGFATSNPEKMAHTRDSTLSHLTRSGTDKQANQKLIKRVSFLEEGSKTRSSRGSETQMGRSFTGLKRRDDSDSDEEEAQESKRARRFMSFNNALYFACAGLLWQSPECVPRAPSARVAAGIWYMVGVITVASYTANMVAFVTHTSTSNRLDDVEKLLEQRIIFPATVVSSSVDSLLMTSNLDVAEKLYKEILRHPHISLQPSVESALNLTNRGELAFVWEGLPLDYAAVKADCHITTIPLGFGKASYAFALAKGSPFTDVFNRQLLEYRQTGFLEQLTEKYFPREACQGDKTSSHDEESYDRLTYSSLSGVFMMVGVATAGGFLILVVEWIVVCLKDIDRTDPNRPPDFSTALHMRYRRLVRDFTANWLPFKDIREHWSKFRPALAKEETVIQVNQWKRFSPSPGSQNLRPGESISDPDLENLK